MIVIVIVLVLVLVLVLVTGLVLGLVLSLGLVLGLVLGLPPAEPVELALLVLAGALGQRLGEGIAEHRLCDQAEGATALQLGDVAAGVVVGQC